MRWLDIQKQGWNLAGRILNIYETLGRDLASQQAFPLRCIDDHCFRMTGDVHRFNSLTTQTPYGVRVISDEAIQSEAGIPVGRDAAKYCIELLRQLTSNPKNEIVWKRFDFFLHPIRLFDFM
jgi:hypothetical protein